MADLIRMMPGGMGAIPKDKLGKYCCKWIAKGLVDI